MMKATETLLAARERIARKNHLTATLQALQTQHDALSQQVLALSTALRKEQTDVDRLEGRSLAAFFYEILGKKDEKLDKERREVYAARAKHDAARRTLEAIAADLQAQKAELDTLQNCEADYDRLLRRRINDLRGARNEDAQEVIRLESRLAELKHRMKELGEAITAGNAALELVAEAQTHLMNAQDLATLDIWGGRWADWEKHRDLDSAQDAIERLQIRLNRFRSELMDVRIETPLQVNIEGFTRFADFFLDNIFSDCAVKKQIDSSIEQVTEVSSKLMRVLRRLKQMRTEAEQETAEAKTALETLALRSESK